MLSYVVSGGRPLFGSVRVQGSKNGALPLLAASILTGGVTVLENVPRLRDVDASLDILRALGAYTGRRGSSVTVDSGPVRSSSIPPELMGRMRSSVFFLGPLLARFGRAEISLPGGCRLGARPIDMHLKALEALGAVCWTENESILVTAPRLTGAVIRFEKSSVGATENAMLAASGAEGVTVIENAAMEPEICYLADYLRSAGVRLSGDGTEKITIEGTPRFEGRVEHTLRPDRIAAATLLFAGASAGGDIELTGVRPGELKQILAALGKMGCETIAGDSSVILRSEGRLRSPGEITTAPYPGFPTDAQPMLAAASLRAGGETVIHETIFENRFAYARELCKLGARIAVADRTARITGVPELYGDSVTAADLRGGAALTVAALAARGTTVINGAEHIERGYEDLPGALRALGAGVNIKGE